MMEQLISPAPCTLPSQRLTQPLANAFLDARFARSADGRLGERRALLVYQMAKVGSTTVLRSLSGLEPDRPVFHVHVLTTSGIRKMERLYRSCRVPALPWAGHLLTSRYLQRELRRGVVPGRWKVVTFVRDPIARNLSLLFQLGPRLIPDFGRRCRTTDPLALLERLEREVSFPLFSLGWFDEELRRVFDVDVLATPFDRTAGYDVYHGPLADVLLIRTDRLSDVGTDALSSFLGLERLRLRSANVRARKANGHRYTRLLERIALPPSYVDSVYETAEVRHFFTANELDRFRERWSGKGRGET